MADLKNTKEDLERNFGEAVNTFKDAMRKEIKDPSTANECIVALDELLSVARQLGSITEVT